MASWSTYREKGLFGLWLDVLKSGFQIVVLFDSYRYLWDSATGETKKDFDFPENKVFSWESVNGFSLFLFSDTNVESEEQNLWVAYLEYECRKVDTFPSFLPFLPGSFHYDFVTPAPALLFLNGQPGTGKRTLLQLLSLLHGGVLLPESTDSVVCVDGKDGKIAVVPEVALLELAEQVAMEKHILGGGFFWGASVYDLKMLCSREILSAQLTQILMQNRYVLSSLSKRSKEEQMEMASFWRSLYGVTRAGFVANLDYQKSRVLGGDTLSVESILEEGRGLRGVVAEFEKEAILKAHARVGRSQHKIANLLKISRGSLQHKLKKYQLESYASTDADSEDREE
ncbi:MAG TPA: helix-turn-helix domain-containing protein [Turneriella sp.]|nr:helix-turn-helix domain-containing protein [Turneriella sp.]